MPDVYIRLTDGTYERSQTFFDRFTLDYDQHGRLTGIEVCDALSVDIDGKPLRIQVSDTDEDIDTA